MRKQNCKSSAERIMKLIKENPDTLCLLRERATLVGNLLEEFTPPTLGSVKFIHGKAPIPQGTQDVSELDGVPQGLCWFSPDEALENHREILAGLAPSTENALTRRGLFFRTEQQPEDCCQIGKLIAMKHKLWGITRQGWVGVVVILLVAPEDPMICRRLHEVNIYQMSLEQLCHQRYLGDLEKAFLDLGKVIDGFHDRAAKRLKKMTDIVMEQSDLDYYILHRNLLAPGKP